MVLSSPAVLKVFCLQCDLFSLAKVYVYNKKGKIVEDDAALDRFESPNPMQSRSQFLWDFMFWSMLGNAHLYMDSDIVERDNAPMYWLNPAQLEWPLDIERKKDKLVFSKAAIADLNRTMLKYRYEDGTTFNFPLSKLTTFTDLTNGVGNWFKGFSRLDALYKVISNSEASLDSKNINVRYAGKFLVAGTQDPMNVSKTPMSEVEKQSIEERVNGDKQVHAIKSMIDIKRFVDDLRVLELDKSFLADYYLVGSMYNIPRDVLEAYASSTYENQEKARAGHVTYTLEPKAEQLGAGVAKAWGYNEKGKRVVLSWDHLPLANIFEKDKANVQATKVNIFNNLLRAGVPIEEINIFLDTNFTINEPEAEETNPVGG